MPRSSCEESCNHHHFPRQYQWLLGCLKLTPGTDAITNPVNAFRYPANAVQLFRAIFSGARTIMVFSGSVFSPALPIVSGISAVASLPTFLINNLTHSVINYTEQQGVLRCYADVNKQQQPNENHHHHHYHLPKPIQALFHLSDSGYRYMAEKLTPQNPQNLAKLKTCLFYGNLALSTTITALGVVALVGGVGAVAATPVGWGLIGLSAVSAVTFVGYSAVKNKYTTLSRQAYQEAFHLNEETKKKLQGQNIEATCETYGLLEPSQVVTQSFSSYLGLNKPKKVLNACFGKHQQQSEKPTSVSEILLNSALLNFAVTSQIEENEKKAIIDSAKQKFKAKDNHSGSIDKKIVDSNEFLYEIATFLAQQEVKTIKGALVFDMDDDIKLAIPLLQEKTLQAENSKNTFSSRSLALLQPKSKKYYDSYIQAQQLLACYRIVRQELAPKNTHGRGHGQGREGRRRVQHDSRDSKLELRRSYSPGRSSQLKSPTPNCSCCISQPAFEMSADISCSQPAFEMPADIGKFKLQLPSYANPNLYNGNRYLDALNRKLFGKGAQDFKLTLRGVKELTKETAESVRPQILLIATTAESVTPPILAIATTAESVTPPILAIATTAESVKPPIETEEDEILNEGPISPIPKTRTKPQLLPTPIINNASIDANTCCGFGLC